MEYGYRILNCGKSSFGFNLTDFKGSRVYVSIPAAGEMTGSLKTDDIEDACLRVETLIKAIYAGFPHYAKIDGDTEFESLVGLNYGRRVTHPTLGTFDVILVDPEPMMAAAAVTLNADYDPDH